MRKVYNLKLDIDAPRYAMTDEQFCNGLKEIIADELCGEVRYVKMTAECVDKDAQIAKLQQTQNQKAIEELNNLKRYCHEWYRYSFSDVTKRLDAVIDDRIKELKGN